MRNKENMENSCEDMFPKWSSFVLIAFAFA